MLKEIHGFRDELCKVRNKTEDSFNVRLGMNKQREKWNF